MTVNKLIQKLQELDGNMKVFTYIDEELERQMRFPVDIKYCTPHFQLVVGAKKRPENIPEDEIYLILD